MPYQTRPLQRLFFDCETAANLENLALMPEPKAPGNLKDPEKIKAAIEEKKQELINNAALDPDYGRVLSIGMATSPDGPIWVGMVDEVIFAEERTLPDGDKFWYEERLSESDLILTFWTNFARCEGRAVGFNILSFDLPYLMARSMYLGVRVPYLPVLAKFRTEPITDLYAIRYNWGPGKGLKACCRLLGIHNECPEVEGSMVKDLKPAELRAYQVSDVKLLIEMYQKMNGVYFCH